MAYSRLGDSEKAKKLQLVILEKQRRLLGDGRPQTLHAMHNLASTYECLNQPKEAEELRVAVLEKRKMFFKKKLQDDVVEKLRRLCGDDHPDTLSAMYRLATINYEGEQFQQAAELLGVVLEKERKLLGDGHPDTLPVMENLAATFRRLDKVPEAEQLEKLIEGNQNKPTGSDSEVPEHP
ncbi:hypothetical protein B0H13DRAFT_1899556 [Mycena leptocephala]|nr:hypothetical protein B0H13DRAFT_1899556 [Mycena leptocephala]